MATIMPHSLTAVISHRRRMQSEEEMLSTSPASSTMSFDRQTSTSSSISSVSTQDAKEAQNEKQAQFRAGMYNVFQTFGRRLFRLTP